MSRKPFLILILVLVVYALISVYRPGGLMAYAFPSICWVLIAIATLWLCGFKKIQSWFNKQVVAMAGLIAVFQIFALINAGFLTRFGRSPYSFTPTYLMINSIYVFSALLGTELSRAYLVKNFGKKKPFLTLGLVTLLYTFISISILGFLSLIIANEPLRLADFLGTSFLPILTENLLASYLALLAGPIASMAYRGPLKAFQWFSPILPDPTWGFKTLIGVMAPTIGFLIISQVTTPSILRRAGIPTETKRPRRVLRPKRSSSTSWVVISLVCLFMVWTATGLLGFYPTIIASGSMTPTMNVGDIAIVISADPSKIQVGDIIQYWQKEEVTLHRVIETRQTELGKLFITKGDANNAPDPDPVFPNQIRGKLILIIPKLGWISIYLKTFIANAWTFLTNNPAIAYTTITIASATIIFGIHRYGNQPLRKLRRRLHGRKP